MQSIVLCRTIVSLLRATHLFDVFFNCYLLVFCRTCKQNVEDMAESENSSFNDLVMNLQMVIDQIKDESVECPDKPDFTMDGFWKRADACVKAVSAAATNLCLAFSQPPFPSSDDSKPLISSLEQSVLALVSSFYYLPVCRGQTLRKLVADSVVNLAEALQTLVKDLHSNTSAQSSKQYLQSTGSVWEICEKFAALPKDNTKAVLLKVKEALSLITDALTELEEAANNADDDDDNPLDDLGEQFGDLDISCSAGWSDADRLVVAACLGLLKTVQATFKKLPKAISASSCDTVDCVTELDSYVVQIAAVSPLVDELVSSLYPPVKLPVVQTLCERLAEVLRDLLDVARSSHFTTDDDVKWIEFLHKAVTHNLDKVNNLIGSMHST